jgi:hypothetical protein
MNFDLWYGWLEPVVAFLLACAFLALGALVGWYARQRQAKRIRKAAAARAPTLVERPADRHDAVAAGEEPIREYKHVMPREWDGGQPRPNWNRFSG